MLKEQLQQQIEQEGLSKASDFGYDPGSEGYYDLKISYERGASKYAALWQAAEEKAVRYEKALKEIANWQLPETGRYWDHGTNLEPMSYEACHGSNGVRDYFKALASDALTPKTSEDDR